MFAGFAIAGAVFVIVVFLHIRLKHHVSKEKLHAIENVSRLWPSGVGPSKIALNEKGLQLRRYSYVSFPLFLIAFAILFVVSDFGLSSFPSFLLFAIVGSSFLDRLFFESRVMRHVSREKICALEDVSRLWKYSWPPKTVLNEKGLRLHRYLKAGVTVFFIGIGIVFVGILVYVTPDNY